LLLTVERDVAIIGERSIVYGVAIKKPFHRFSIGQKGKSKLRSIFRGDPTIKETFRFYDHKRTPLAKTVTSCALDCAIG
jgi:hypothetical protein